jgi:hypothetical protein
LIRKRIRIASAIQEIIDNDFMVQLLHKIGSQPGCAFWAFSMPAAGCNGGKPLSHNNIARLKKRVTMRAFQAGWGWKDRLYEAREIY